ncbi:MAG TPA: membrane protein insertase YidC [Gammaproteobacteria bacterium]|nr:membrane protein insertase YidC [Gammaproteobacteria bacterium]
MDNVRLLLFMALAFVSLLIWEAWQKDHAQLQPTPQTQTTADAAVPQVPATAQSATDLPTPEAKAAEAQASAELVHVRTDTLDMKIDPVGATIAEVDLIKYPVSVDQPDKPTRLMSRDPADFFIAQSGLIGSPDSPAPLHTARFQASQQEYRLAEGADSLSVDFTWTSPEGVQVIKRFTFQRGRHSFHMEQIVKNGSDKPWQGREYRQLQRGEPTTGNGNALMVTYTGGAIYTPEDKYRKIPFDELAEGQPDLDTQGGWVAMLQHYFLGAIVPPENETHHFYGKAAGPKRYVLGLYTPPRTVAPGEETTFGGILFAGPKLVSELRTVSEGLDLTVDYGWLVFLAKPIHWILEQINGFVGNWGWTIIIFTILIKLAFFKLSETSYRSMAQMRKLGPRIQALKDRYGDDKQRMQQAMMEIYKKEKINPLGGCLPMLVQIPFFIALYWVLLENVEMRQAPWILWIKDLSIKDPYFVLPVIMALSMWVQQKLNPAPPDPMQAKIMSFLPLVFGFMFAFFPSGLVLYWVVNNILSIAQQWVITRRIEQGAKA